MSVAVIRECHRCRLPLQKADGCNKLTCSCRATMCYVCRAPNINYNHFCPHPREPGQKCTICTKCSLWEDVEKLDRAKLRQLQADANEKLDKTHKIAVVPVRSPSSVRPPVRRPPARWPPGPQPRHPRYPPPGFENHSPPPFVPPPHHPMNVQGRAYNVRWPIWTATLRTATNASRKRIGTNARIHDALAPTTQPHATPNARPIARQHAALYASAAPLIHLLVSLSSTNVTGKIN